MVLLCGVTGRCINIIQHRKDRPCAARRWELSYSVTVSMHIARPSHMKFDRRTSGSQAQQGVHTSSVRGVHAAIRIVRTRIKLHQRLVFSLLLCVDHVIFDHLTSKHVSSLSVHKSTSVGKLYKFCSPTAASITELILHLHQTYQQPHPQQRAITHL